MVLLYFYIGPFQRIPPTLPRQGGVTWQVGHSLTNFLPISLERFETCYRSDVDKLGTFTSKRLGETWISTSSLSRCKRVFHVSSFGHPNDQRSKYIRQVIISCHAVERWGTFKNKAWGGGCAKIPIISLTWLEHSAKICEYDSIFLRAPDEVAILFIPPVPKLWTKFFDKIRKLKKLCTTQSVTFPRSKLNQSQGGFVLSSVCVGFSRVQNPVENNSSVSKNRLKRWTFSILSISVNHFYTCHGQYERFKLT